MTTMTTMTEAESLEIAAGLDNLDPAWTPAIETIISRAGTRDAFLVAMVHQNGDRTDDWDLALARFMTFDPSGVPLESRKNYRALTAAMLLALGEDRTAAVLIEGQRDHRMSGLMLNLIESGIPMAVWLGSLGDMTVEECLAYPR